MKDDTQVLKDIMGLPCMTATSCPLQLPFSIYGSIPGVGHLWPASAGSASTLTTQYINENLLLGSNCNPLERTEMLTNIDYLRQTTEN